MTHDPLRRRFGYGAARLPIGTSTQGPSLAQLAQRRVAGERIFAGAPAGLCFALAALLFTAMQLDFTPGAPVMPRELAPQLADRTEEIPPLTLEFWEEQDVIPAAKEPTITPAPVVIAEAPEIVPMPEAAPVAPAPAFDPTQLVLGTPPSAPLGDPLLSSPAPTPPRAAARRPSTRTAGTPRPQINLPTRADITPAEILTAGLSTGKRSPSARPRAGTTQGSPKISSPGWAANSDQRAFLTAQAETHSAGATRGSGPNRLSPVSASAETRAKAERIRDELATGGWQQVPLDTLPDCSPPGRQDALKRRILRAASAQPTCSDQHGSFKFIETSNLGAFLMWSRTNPEAFSQTGRDRDACVVLERALRCLSISSY